MDKMNNSGPRFIEVYGTYNPHHMGDTIREVEMDTFYINWYDVMGFSPMNDGWIMLTMRELDISSNGDWLSVYRDVCIPLWIKEDLRHFVRRVNEGWSITEL